MANNSDISVPGRRSETIYHPGPRIVVTSRRIETRDGRYYLRDLDGVHVVHEYAHPARTIALVLAGLEVVAALPLAADHSASPLICAAILGVVGLGVAVLSDSRKNPRWMTLVGEHRGHTVALFSTGNRHDFEQVRRAVVRAVEAGEEARWTVGRAITVAAGSPGRPGSSPARPRRSDRTSKDPA